MTPTSNLAFIAPGILPLPRFREHHTAVLEDRFSLSLLPIPAEQVESTAPLIYVRPDLDPLLWFKRHLSDAICAHKSDGASYCIMRRV